MLGRMRQKDFRFLAGSAQTSIFEVLDPAVARGTTSCLSGYLNIQFICVCLSLTIAMHSLATFSEKSGK